MKLFKLAFFSFILIFFFNCTEDETPVIDSEAKENPKLDENPINSETEVYFTYSSSGGADNWLVIQNSEGKVIDYKKVENGGPVEFKANKDSIPDEISITEIWNSGDPALNQINSHSLLTYTNIAPGSTFNSTYNQPQGATIGKFSVHIENIPGLRSNTISTQRGSFNAGSSNSEGNFYNSKLNLLDITLFEDEEYLISLYDTNGGHKYLFLDSPEDNSDLTFDYADLVDYDYYLVPDLPNFDSALLFTYGYSESDPNYFWTGQALSNLIDSNTAVAVKGGYLDRYQKYRTDFSINQDGFRYGFSKTGNRIEEIIVPTKPFFQLENASVFDLKIATDLDFKSKKTTHNYRDIKENLLISSTTWWVYSDGTDSHKIGVLPEDFLLAYPTLNLDKLELQSVSLKTKGFSQQEFFDQQTSQERRGDYIIEHFVFSTFE